MDERDASEVANWRDTQHELWITMQTAYGRYKHASAVLETMVSSKSGDVPLEDETLSVELAADKQREAFENYVESRLGFSDFSHTRARCEVPDREPKAAGRTWPALGGVSLTVAGMVVTLFGTMTLGATYLAHMHQKLRDLNESRNELIATLNQTRDRISVITEKMDSFNVDRQLQDSQRVKAPRVRQLRPMPFDGRQNRKSPPRAADRLRTDQQSWLHSIGKDQGERAAENREALARIQALGKPFNYYFTLTKSQQFTRVGPLQMSLLVVNAARKDFDLCFVTDDFKFYKKHGSLDEPLRVSLSSPRRSLELVVQRIDNNRVQGYLSVLKSRKPALATSQILRRGPGRS